MPHPKIHKITLSNRIKILKEILFRVEVKSSIFEPDNFFLKDEIKVLDWAIEELSNKYNIIPDKIKVRGFIPKMNTEQATRWNRFPFKYLQDGICVTHGPQAFIKDKRSEAECIECARNRKRQ